MRRLDSRQRHTTGLAFAAAVTLTSTTRAGCDLTNGGDTFANAVDMGAIPVAVCGNTCDNTATIDANCATGDSGGVANRDEWWRLTIATSGLHYELSMCSLDDFDSKLYVYDTMLELVGCNDDGCATYNGPARIGCLPLDAGTYYVVVDGYAEEDCGDYELSVSECIPCTNILPGNATQMELEDCATGEPTNDGCIANGETELLSIGVTVGGTATYDGAVRDTDWYRYEINEPGLQGNMTYAWTVDAEFPAIFGLVQTNWPGNPDCGDVTGYISPAAFIRPEDNCAQASLTTQCLPGQFDGGVATYRFFIAPQFLFVTDCAAESRNAYEATLESTPCCIDCNPVPCFPTDFHRTQNLDPTIVEGSVACVQGKPEGQHSSDNIFARVYENTDGEVEITCIEAGIETNSSTADQFVTFRVLFSPTAVPDINLAVLQDSVTLAIPGLFGPSRASIDFTPIHVDDGQHVIVEMFWDATTPGVDPVGALFPGANTLGQTAPTYILSNGCGITNYTDLADIGFPDQAVILDYFANAICAADITSPGGADHDGNVDALDFLVLIAQWGSPCTVGGCEADITGPTPLVPDGNVDSLDYFVLISQWGSPGNCP